tara:strand:+ start:104 stop:1084 length:981 start_codon:yes stop_codon:yes gene_type:complete
MAFSTFIDSCITIVISLITTFTLVAISKWIFLGAEWDVVIQNLPLYIFGVFPPSQRWRPTLWLIALIALAIFTLFAPRGANVNRLLPIAWISVIPFGAYLLSGGLGLLPIASRYWGGLTLTILLTSCSALIAFPLGICLAIGRQSELPLIRYLSSLYIDVIRAVPLIAVLFFGQLLIPIFLPIGFEINRVIRAILAFAFFVAGYIAEDIRGGLQSIPKGQTEGANALGLSKRQITQYIVLPQAIRIALPALTNQAIGLLQNTSLMAILGLVELLGISQSILANPEFIGRYIEVYVWLAGIYWLICTIMALLARHLEKRMTIGKTNF